VITGSLIVLVSSAAQGWESRWDEEVSGMREGAMSCQLRGAFVSCVLRRLETQPFPDSRRQYSLVHRIEMQPWCTPGQETVTEFRDDVQTITTDRP